MVVVVVVVAAADDDVAAVPDVVFSPVRLVSCEEAGPPSRVQPHKDIAITAAINTAAAKNPVFRFLPFCCFCFFTWPAPFHPVRYRFRHHRISLIYLGTNSLVR